MSGTEPAVEPAIEPEPGTDGPAWFTDRRTEWAIVAIAMLVAYLLRFVIDDGYISFRYARNMADGRGLIFNPGERVEGYTNYLWTLILAAAFKLDLSAETVSYVFSIASTGAAVLATIRIGRILSGRTSVAFWAAVLLVTNAAFISFGTSGLETMFQTALLALAAWVAVAAWEQPTRVWQVATFALLTGLAFLTRLDSALVIGALGLGWLWRRRSLGATPKELALVAVGGASGVIVMGVPWFIWKHDFYGEWLPNTFHAKENGLTPMGVIFLGLFVVSYVWFGPALAIVAKFKVWVREPGYAVAGAVVALWALYVIYAGGDWMDWRFLVAVMPFMFLLAARSIVALDRPILRNVAIATCIVGSIVHGLAYPPTFNVDGLSTVRLLTEQDPPNWITEGKALAGYFPGGLDEPDQVTIAVVAAGAIPYFSELPAIDMIGLTDAEVARNGDIVEYSSGISKPGHVKMAKMSYLRERGVNLILGIPYTVAPADLKDSYPIDDPAFFTIFHEAKINLTDLGDDPTLVAIPVDGRLMLAVYLTPNPKIDAFIDDGWKTVPITP